MYRSYERYYDPMNGYCKSEGMNLQYLYIEGQKASQQKHDYKKVIKNLFHLK